jgi:hypothetical protein
VDVCPEQEGRPKRRFRHCLLRSIISVTTGTCVIAAMVASVSASRIPADIVNSTFLPITVANGCTLTAGFSVSGPWTCGVNAQTNGARYVYISGPPPHVGGGRTHVP